MTQADESEHGAEVSGNLVIALRRDPSAKNEFLLLLGFESGTKTSGSGGYSGDAHKIKMDPDPSLKLGDNIVLGGPKWETVVDNQFISTKFVDNKEVPWLNVKLVKK